MTPPRAREDRFDAEGFDESGTRPGVSREWIEVGHFFATTGTSFVALAACFRETGSTGWLIAATASAIGFLGLIVSRSLSLLIGDLYRQMQYRERFLVFLVHMGLVLVPWLTRLASLPVALMGLLLVLSFQCIDKLFTARLQALQWTIMLVACSGAGSPPAAPLVIGFGVVMFLSIRLSHIRFRLERYERPDLSMPLEDLLGRSTLRLLPIGLVGWMTWVVAHGSLTPRELVYTPTRLHPGTPTGQPLLSLEQTVWLAVALIVVIVGTLVSLSLLDKFLKKKQSANIPVGEVGGMATRGRSSDRKAAIELVEAIDATPRQRVLEAYRYLSDKLGQVGLNPARGETASTWLTSRELDPQSIHAFDVACYSTENISEEVADAFTKTAKQIAEAETANTRV